MERSHILKYLVSEYYGGSVENFALDTEYSPTQIRSWMSGDVQPQKDTLDYIFNCMFTPRIQVIAEFAKLDSDEEIRPQLRSILSNFGEAAGLYAFYDSMANLIYLGKAKRLFQEIYSALRRDVNVEFPNKVEFHPTHRYELVRYVSAYQVATYDWLDYPKQLKSLILRISKPPLNRNIGNLEKAYIVEDA